MASLTQQGPQFEDSLPNELALLSESLEHRRDETVLIWRGVGYTGAEVLSRIRCQRDLFSRHGIGPGSVVVLRGDYSLVSVAALVCLIELRTIIAPLLPETLQRNPRLASIANPDFVLDASGEGIEVIKTAPAAPHGLVTRLRKLGEPGLILFTSGSSGQPKGVVHNFSKLLHKFATRRPAMRTLNFLLFDHWGGLNTLLHCVTSGSCVVLPEDRTPEHICGLIERHMVELLPTSPTFLNLMLLSKTYESRDLRSLRLITYGSEPMHAPTLARLASLFPKVEFRQTYGSVEIGVLRSKSLSRDSLWVKIGGSGYDVRVIDGILQIKAEAQMLGYLNAPTPITEDGYFITGDRVEVDGGYCRILGRDSDLINVGGRKVFPSEVESVLLECTLVSDALVYGEPNPITGRIVCADIVLRKGVPDPDPRRSIKSFCAGRLEPYRIPVRIRFVERVLETGRLKRQRTSRIKAGQ